MSEVTKPILLDETGQSIVTKLEAIKTAIEGSSPAGEPVFITVVTPPTKTQYGIGETFDPTGIAVSAVFNNGSYFDITNQCTYSPLTPLTLDDETITVSWVWHETGHTFTTTQAITLGAAPWSTGTDAQIVAALEAHYAGLIDVTDYWSVGDERTMSLSAMAATGVGESHAAQTIKMVLLNEGGKTLTDGVTECAFVVGQKDSLTEETGNDEKGYMHSTTASGINWSNCARRTWCNEIYRNAIPSSIRSIFKQFKNVSSASTDSSTVNTDDYFALYAEKEIYGASNTNPQANTTAESTLSQFKYYETSSNRAKNGTTDSFYSYWLRSHASSGVVNSFCFARYSDYGDYGDANENLNIAPFGVI